MSEPFDIDEKRVWGVADKLRDALDGERADTCFVAFVLTMMTAASRDSDIPRSQIKDWVEVGTDCALEVVTVGSIHDAPAMVQ